VKQVVVGQTTVWIEVDSKKLVETLLGHKLECNAAANVQKPYNIKLTANFQPLRRGGELRLVAPKNSSFEGTPIPSLVKAVARARDWYERIISGEVRTVGQLAQKTSLPSSYVKRLLRCALLSPHITETVLTGEHRPNLTLQELLRRAPIDWREQQHHLCCESEIRALGAGA
jgi:site-specific DNA recombinase